MRLDWKFEGGTEFDTMLKDLGPRVAKRVALKALRAGARIVREDAKQRVPVLTGELKRSIKTKSRKARVTNERTVSVGVAGKEGPLAHLVEFGSAPHTIEAKPGKVLADPKTGKVFGRKVSHPGTPPKPYLRPAADTKAGEALAELGRVLGEGIAAEAVKRG